MVMRVENHERRSETGKKKIIGMSGFPLFSYGTISIVVLTGWRWDPAGFIYIDKWVTQLSTVLILLPSDENCNFTRMWWKSCIKDITVFGGRAGGPVNNLCLGVTAIIIRLWVFYIFEFVGVISIVSGLKKNQHE